MLERNKHIARRLAPVLLPLAAALLIAGGWYIGSLYVWGDIPERLSLRQDTTTFYEKPYFVGAIEMMENEQPLRPYSLWLKGDTLLVTYVNSNRVDMLDSDFNLLGSLDLGGGEGGMISSIASDSRRFYVADIGRGEVRIHDSTGGILDAYLWLPGKAGRIMPHGISVHQGILYITDIRNRLLLAVMLGAQEGISEAGELLFSVPKPGSGKNYFEFPAGTAVTPDGRILVTDLSAGVLQVFTCNGRFAYSLPDSSDTVLKAPNSIAFDNALSPELLERAETLFDPSGVLQQGRIHVVDREMKRVVIFDALGKQVLYYGEGHLEVPNGIAIDQNRRVIVIADSQSSELVIFRY